jgi:hypothetical protein
MSSLSSSQFAKTYKPSEYGASWSEVRGSEEFHRPIEGAMSHEEMVSDVKKHGVRSPVMVYGGRVVDGHHRVLAAMDAGQAIPFEHSPSELYEGQIK